MATNNISNAQITEFLKPLSFSVLRTEENDRTGVAKPSNPNVVTKDLNESLKLLSGASKRLANIKENLKTMLDLAKSAGRAGANTREKDEALAKMRSLTAGIDVITEQTAFSGQRVLDGRTLELSTSVNPNGPRRRMDVSSMFTTGVESLGLSLQKEGGHTRVWYDVDSLVNNQQYGMLTSSDVEDPQGNITRSEIAGLDITEATPAPVDLEKQELASGDYRLKISTGPTSTLELRDMDGVLKGKLENVDLSGDGQEMVDFGLGFRLSFKKENIFGSIMDKYDYVHQGPAILYANIAYEQVYMQKLDTGDDPQTMSIASSAELKSTFVKTSATGDLRVLKASPNAVDEDKLELETGTYSVKIAYNGANSKAELYDSYGVVRSSLYGLDLSATGEKEINFGVGLKVKLKNNSFGTDTTTLNATVDYKRVDTGGENFDFATFGSKLDSALKVVDGQIQSFDKVQKDLTDAYKFQEYLKTFSAANRGAGIASMFGATYGTSVADMMGSGGMLAASTAMIFSGTSQAMSVQANQRANAVVSLM